MNTDDHLWREARNQANPGSVRTACLLELIETSQSDEVVRFVLSELSTNPDEGWRSVLLYVMEWARPKDKDLRKALADESLRQAQTFTESRRSAIRRFGSIAEASRIVELQPFLTDSDPLTVQTALHAMQNMLGDGPLSSDLPLEELKAQVQVLAEPLAQLPASHNNTAKAVLAINAFLTLALLGGPRVGQLEAVLLRGPWYGSIGVISNRLLRGPVTTWPDGKQKSDLLALLARLETAHKATN